MPKLKSITNIKPNISEVCDVNPCTQKELIHNNEKNKQKCFVCDLCDFKCSKLSDWNRHISTSKHLNIKNHINSIQKNDIKYECICGKSYGYSSNYYTHRKKCLSVIENQNTTVVATQQDNALITLVSEVVKSNNEIQRQNLELQKQTNELQKQNQEIQKQNQEMQKQILDICKNGLVNNLAIASL